tara:strand:+ start:514 stop:834 length:321 start_codon:yes stop_codon:yes gene_type:complete
MTAIMHQFIAVFTPASHSAEVIYHYQTNTETQSVSSHDFIWLISKAQAQALLGYAIAYCSLALNKPLSTLASKGPLNEAQLLAEMGQFFQILEELVNKEQEAEHAL